MKASCHTATCLLTALFLLTTGARGFVWPASINVFGGRNLVGCRQSERDDATSSYETSGASSKGIVSSLTGLVNFVMTPGSAKDDDPVGKTDGCHAWLLCAFVFHLMTHSTILPPLTPSSMPDALEQSPPTSTTELMTRIRDDYTVGNYLWTGDLDLASFEKDCRFTDPTLSFVGTDKFVSNVSNLRVIVDKLILEPDDCRSDLLDIFVNQKEQYVQSRWNMVGKLNALPWKPMIDVIGRTKFWYREVEDGGYRVYFYDECWELPAAQALLQLVTPAGTIPNRSKQ